MSIPRRICIALFLASLLAPTESRAALVLFLETKFANPGESGFVQASLLNTSTTSQDLSGFSLDLSLVGPGVTLTSVDNQTDEPYVFGNSGVSPLTFNSFPNSGFLQSDVFDDQPGFATVDPGQFVGLARIGFRVDSNATPGLRPLTILAGPRTEFSDGDLNAITDVELNSGGIVVTGTQAVPEPSVFVMALGVIGVTFASRAVGSRFRGKA